MHPPAHIADSRSKEQRQSPINGTSRVKPSSCPWEGPSEGPHRLCPPQSYEQGGHIGHIKLRASDIPGTLFTPATDNSHQLLRSFPISAVLLTSHLLLPDSSDAEAQNICGNCSTCMHVQSVSTEGLIPNRTHLNQRGVRTMDNCHLLLNFRHFWDTFSQVPTDVNNRKLYLCTCFSSLFHYPPSLTPVPLEAFPNRRQPRRQTCKEGILEQEHSPFKRHKDSITVIKQDGNNPSMHWHHLPEVL